MTHKVLLLMMVITTGKLCSAEENQPIPIGTEKPTNITSFESYLDAFNKKYFAKYRIDRRRNAFEKNLEEINSHNQNFADGKSQFKMGLNNFADLDNELYKKQMVRMRDTNHRKMDVEINDELVGAVATPKGMPDSLDWRTKGFVTDPVNQKTCGSCYAFSISYAISAQILQRINRIEFVSQQQLVDCSTETGNQVFIALFVATLAVAAQAGHVSTSWPAVVDSHGWNSWNGWDGVHGWNDWNGVYPYGVNQWSSSWPTTHNGYNGWWNDKTVAKVNPWGLWNYPYGTNSWSSSAWPLYNGYNGVKTVVQANVAKVNPWGLPLAYGNGYNNYWGAVPAAKYVAANPGSVHVAPLAGHAVNQKLIVA